MDWPYRSARACGRGMPRKQSSAKLRRTTSQKASKFISKPPISEELLLGVFRPITSLALMQLWESLTLASIIRQWPHHRPAVIWLANKLISPKTMNSFHLGKYHSPKMKSRSMTSSKSKKTTRSPTQDQHPPNSIRKKATSSFWNHHSLQGGKWFAKPKAIIYIPM